MRGHRAISAALGCVLFSGAAAAASFTDSVIVYPGAGFSAKRYELELRGQIFHQQVRRVLLTAAVVRDWPLLDEGHPGVATVGGLCLSVWWWGTCGLVGPRFEGTRAGWQATAEFTVLSRGGLFLQATRSPRAGQTLEAGVKVMLLEIIP